MSELANIIAPIVIAIFGSSGFWAYISSKRSKHSEILTSVQNLEKTLVKVSEKVDTIERNNAEIEAKNTRTRIVRFADEIRIGIRHSKDMYDQVLIDCDSYEDFCNRNDWFLNSIAEVSIKKIKEHYENDDFL